MGVGNRISLIRDKQNKLAAQVEYRSTLSSGKKMKRVPHDVPADQSGKMIEWIKRVEIEQK